MFKDSPAALHGAISGRPILKSSHGQDAMDLIRQRIATCSAFHTDRCRRGIGGSVVDDVSGTLFPTRLIHIDSADYHVLRVVEMKGQRGRYATLSHCWGPPSKQPTRSLQSNINHFHRRLPWEILSKTFQDAIYVCHTALSLEYLWIDSICIIQDDLVDWENEAPKMGQYYQNSFLTIAAAYAQNADEGLSTPLTPKPLEIILMFIRTFL